jgi:hypothetical protein
MVLNDVITKTVVKLSDPSFGMSAACTESGNSDAAASASKLYDMM